MQAIAWLSIAGMLLFVLALAYPRKGLLPRLGRWLDPEEGAGNRREREQLVTVGVLAVVAIATGVWALTYSHAPPDDREQTAEDRSWGLGLGAAILGVTASLLLLLYLRRRAARRTRHREACKEEIRQWTSQGYVVPEGHKCVGGEVFIPRPDG